MEEEDTYGFGSFSELFDAGASSQKQKRLDLGALSRFCMSERLLSRFQQQQRRDKRCVMFQHVAAKFDGVGIDGGLGALGVAALEGGGVVWLQTAQSDSDALERRKKELRDITNRAPQETKSAAALFVALTHVASVQPTTVQNTVQGVELKLTDGNRLELTFMPGPFAGAAHRDEFLQVLKKCMAVAAASTSSASVRTSATTSCAELEAVKSGSGEPKAAAASETTGAAQKEEFRQLVRRYINVDPLSEEGVEIAKQVHAGTGYLLGPTMKQPPKFSADAEYRKKTVSELAEFLKRMNKEWSDADAHRELHTKAKHSRNEDGLFEYTDTVTGAQIPPRVYEERYLELLQWKKRNDAKREVKAKLQEDERVEEEEYYLSLPKCLPQDRVEAAAIRNYRAAGELRWKRLMLQAVAEKQQLDEQETECIFRPRTSCAASTAKVDSAELPSPRRRRSATGDVFERLYKPRTQTTPAAPLALQKRSEFPTKPKQLLSPGRNVTKSIASVDAYSLQLSNAFHTNQDSPGTRRKYVLHCASMTLTNSLIIIDASKSVMTRSRIRDTRCLRPLAAAAHSQT
ncbi:Zinc finger, RING-type [Phytophthora cinnamomi]|uniref:Zinc finger, RING-type n=1 Tax=Phytophthora cinnamomi TaxID=4785 RepID=UPI00355A77C6|nr:Zinc finger, RING-type [Phytophthora cinnamomi]